MNLTPDELDALVRLATSAPSVHNSQPWRFAVTSDGLLLSRDPDRQLTALDPEGRELLLSCGAACHHLQVAARGAGVDVQTTLLPPGETDVVARFVLTPGARPTAQESGLAAAISRRHTHRGRFDDEVVPPATLDRLRLAVEEQHAMLRNIRPDELPGVAVLVSRAEHALQGQPAYVDELARWVWPDDASHVDGMSAAAVDHGEGRAESLTGRAFQPGSTERPGGGEPPVPEHPVVVLLTTQGDGALDWVRAGQGLSALLLTATDLDLVAQPISQVIDVPDARWALQRLLGAVGAPQMLLRLGRAAAAVAAPRRAVDDVLTGTAANRSSGSSGQVLRTYS